MKIRGRFIRVAVIFTRMLLDFYRESKLVKKRGFQYSQKKMYPVHERRAWQLYNTAISLGGVLIKLCQFFSSRYDIFAEPYIRILSTLQDDVPPVEFNEIENLLHHEYGDYSKYFKVVEKESLASASLGQVHKAVLIDGREAVIKILKPGIEETIDIDFAILFQIVRFISRFKSIRDRIDLKQLFEEFITVTGDELNFLREIHVARVLKKNLEKFNYVKIPEIYEEYCTKRIIVMEFMTGDKISDVAGWEKRNNDPVIIVRRLIEIYLEQYIFIGFVHYDPHPGNILISDNNNIALLDFGMSGEISERMRQGIKNLIQAFISRDYFSIVDTLGYLGFLRKNANKKQLVNIFRYFLNDVLETLKLDRESIQTVDLSPIRDELVEIIYTQPITIPIEWAFIGKSVGTLAGIIAKINPEFKLRDELKPFAEKLISMNYLESLQIVFDNIKKNVNSLLTLPEKADLFMQNLESGYIKVKVDYSEVFNKVDRMQTFAVRFLSLVISVFSGVISYIFYTLPKLDVSIIFLSISVLFLPFAIFYKKISARDIIRDYLNR